MGGFPQGCKLFAIRRPSDGGGHVGMPWLLLAPRREPFGELRVNYASRTSGASGALTLKGQGPAR
jgi:hypothetical protein